MNKILLIDRLNPHNDSDEKHEVFFMLGGMQDPREEDRIIDVLNESTIVDSKDMVLKYNGVELNITVQDIPMVTKMLTENKIAIYGIYQIYSPDELLI